MGVTKDEKKRIDSLKELIHEHRQKIQEENRTGNPNWGRIRHWEREIDAWEKEVARRERRLRIRRRRG